VYILEVALISAVNCAF